MSTKAENNLNDVFFCIAMLSGDTQDERRHILYRRGLFFISFSSKTITTPLHSLLNFPFYISFILASRNLLDVAVGNFTDESGKMLSLL